jgi:hypothetical protein
VLQRKREHRPGHFDLAASAEDHPRRAGSDASFKLYVPYISWLPPSVDICSIDTSTERQTTSHHALHITPRGYRDFSSKPTACRLPEKKTHSTMNTRPAIENSSNPVALSASFNQDASCFSVGLDTGFCSMPNSFELYNQTLIPS